MVGASRVERRDRRLHLERTRKATSQRRLDERGTFLDGCAVPSRAVLLVEGSEQPLGVDACVSPRVVEQHEREQRLDLGFAGQQAVEQAPQPDRLGAQLAPHQRIARGGAVALVEHEVDDREHRVEPVGQLVGRRHSERDARGFDLALRPHEPLRHRRLWNEERTSDRRGRQTGHGAQRERDLRFQRQRGVAAKEDEAQLVVGHRVERVVGLGVERFEGLECRRPERSALRDRCTAQPIDRAPPRRGRDPGCGPVGDAGRRPRAAPRSRTPPALRPRRSRGCG